MTHPPKKRKALPSHGERALENEMLHAGFNKPLSLFRP